MLRSAIEFVVCLGLAVALTRTWGVEGFVVPSGSMADTLRGVHRRVTCRDCGHAFECDADLRPVAGRAVCPNCGFTGNDLAALPDIDGDRLLVHKLAFQVRRPRRWELVVFRSPHESSKVFVKRVVGLPGETIEVRGGDVYIDGRIASKSLDVQRGMAVLVHDAAHRPSLNEHLPPRWRGDGPQTAWEATADGFVCHPPAGAANQRTDWLSYRHWRRAAGMSSQVEECPIRDDCGYNQTAPRLVEDSHHVTDLMLSFEFTASGEGELLLNAADGREQFEARLDFAAQAVELDHNGKLVARAEGIELPERIPMQCEFSLMDQQALLALDGRLLLEPYPFAPSDRPLQPTSRPLAIGSRGLEVHIGNVRVLRDVYYTECRDPRAGWGQSRPCRLADDEYFVLGDNSPVSVDSRAWPAGAGVAAELLVGKPLVVHLPSRYLDWGWTQFEVPDLARIRYLR